MAGDDDELLTIGEVAKLDGITAKALRYYDAHNILKPAAVDPATGYRLPTTDYRYYTPDQMLDVDVMRICIAAGHWIRWRNSVSKTVRLIGERYLPQRSRRWMSAFSNYDDCRRQSPIIPGNWYARPSPPKMGWCVPICCRLGWLHNLASTVMFAI